MQIWARPRFAYILENGIERRVTPRVLRATVGARLARQGFPIKFIAMLLRHEDEATALRYYTVQEFEEFRQALEAMPDPNTNME